MNKAAIVSEGSIPVLIDVARNGSAEAKMGAAGALGSLAWNSAENQAAPNPKLIC